MNHVHTQCRWSQIASNYSKQVVHILSAGGGGGGGAELNEFFYMTASQNVIQMSKALLQ